MREVVLASRRLRAHPGLIAVAITTFGLSIGAAAATWALVEGVLLRPLAVEAPEHLYVVRLQYSGRSPGLRAHSYALYKQLSGPGGFERLAAGGSWSSLVKTHGEVVPREVYFASGNYFATLGVRPVIGRLVEPADDTRGAPLVAVLSERLWRRAFAGDAGAVGATINVGSERAVIIGVAPGNFRGLTLDRSPELYMPLETVGRVGEQVFNYFAEADHPRSPTAWLEIVLRLDGSRGDVQAATDKIRARGTTVTGERGRYSLVGATEAAIPEPERPSVVRLSQLLVSTVSLLLLAGCMTVGALLLVTTAARRHEHGILLALGATPARVAAGIVLEGSLLIIASLVVAIPLSKVIVVSLGQFELPGGMSIELLSLSVTPSSVLISLIAGVSATAIVAIVAGAKVMSSRLTLGSFPAATSRFVTRRLSIALIPTQVAVTFVLLVGALLLGRSVANVKALNPHIPAGNLVVGHVAPTSYGYSSATAAAYVDKLLQMVRAHPAVRGATAGAFYHATPGSYALVDGVKAPIPGVVYATLVDREYFETLGLRVFAGRGFEERDRTGSPIVGIASASLAVRLDTGSGAVGRRYAFEGGDEAIEVVGVVPDVITDVTNLEPLVMYLPWAQYPRQTSATVLIRTEAAPDGVIEDVHRLAALLDPVVKIGPFDTMGRVLAGQVSAQRFGLRVLGGLGVTGFLLTVMGASVLAVATAGARRREVGIRSALGARRLQVITLVLRETWILGAIGVGAGLILVWLGAGLVESLLFGVAALDLLGLGCVAASIVGILSFAGLRVAWEASSVNPAELLRDGLV